MNRLGHGNASAVCLKISFRLGIRLQLQIQHVSRWLCRYIYEQSTYFSDCLKVVSGTRTRGVCFKTYGN